MKRLDYYTLGSICELAGIPGEAHEDFAEDLHNARAKAVHREAFEALANEVDDGTPKRALELAAELEAEVGPHPDITYYRVLAQRQAASANAPVRAMDWAAFREAGLLWWVNRGLHLFGWAIVVVTDDHGTVTDVYPARTQWRGFSEAAEDRGFEALTRHMAQEAPALLSDVVEDDEE